MIKDSESQNVSSPELRQTSKQLAPVLNLAALQGSREVGIVSRRFATRVFTFDTCVQTGFSGSSSEPTTDVYGSRRVPRRPQSGTRR